MRLFAQLVALARAAFSVGWIVAPKQVNSSWLGGGGVEDPAILLSRSAAARDLGLGLGAFAATRDGGGAPWFAAHALADAADLASTLAGRESFPERGVRQTVALAGGSMLACIACAVALARD